MIEQTPGITRLLDRLEAKKTVRRERSKADRRQYLVSITPKGLETLEELDALVDEMEKENFHPLKADELRLLVDLLERLRATW
jgi:DNA-binding MarR family transcriptional regulator